MLSKLVLLQNLKKTRLFQCYVPAGPNMMLCQKIKKMQKTVLTLQRQAHLHESKKVLEWA